LVRSQKNNATNTAGYQKNPEGGGQGRVLQYPTQRKWEIVIGGSPSERGRPRRVRRKQLDHPWGVEKHMSGGWVLRNKGSPRNRPRQAWEIALPNSLLRGGFILGGTRKDHQWRENE